MPQNKSKDFAIINIRELARLSGLQYRYIYNNITGVYGSWDEQVKTRLFNAMQTSVEKAALALGFSYEGKVLHPSIPGPKKRVPRKKIKS